MAKVTRSYRIRTYPNGAQRRLRDRWFGAYRWLWNTALEMRSAAQCLRDQDAAFRNFYSGRARYPRFKRKSATGSLRFQDVGAAWSRRLPSLPKLGVLKLAEALPEVERPDRVTLSRDAAGRYSASFCAQVEKSPPPRQRLKVARVHARVKQERQYALHALTTQLIREFDLILHDKILVEVGRWFPSSKRCSNCRHTLDELRLDERQWQCPKCGTLHDRDVNAARNLLTEGLRQLAGRDDRDLCVDAGDACPEATLVQVLAEEARSGQRNRACREQASFG